MRVRISFIIHLEELGLSQHTAGISRFSGRENLFFKKGSLCTKSYGPRKPWENTGLVLGRSGDTSY